MFESIRGALSKSTQASNNSTSNIMRLRPGNTYVVRLVPYVKDPSKTFFHYYSHGWVSEATGQYQSAISPQTWGDRDPIAEARFRITRTGSEDEKEKAKMLNRKENWLINVFVVKDNENPENEGKVKILRFGRQLHKIIMEAIEGEDAEEFGEKIFDLTDSGCNLRIKVEEQGGFPTYVSSRFASPSDIDATPDSVYSEAFDLENVFPVKSYDELEVMLNEHYYNKRESDTSTAVVSETVPSTTTPDTDDDDDLDFDTVSTPAGKVDEDKVKNLLDSLD